MPGQRSLSIVLAVLALRGAGCSSSDDVDELIGEAFMECMANEDVTVPTSGSRRAIAVGTSTRSPGIMLVERGDETVGEACVDTALDQFDVSQT